MSEPLQPRDGALYRGRVMHHRLRPYRRRFTYAVFSLCLDIDRIGDWHRRLRLFSHNRFNLFSFHDRDHGPRDGSPLRPWLDGVLADVGLSQAGHRVSLLCYPRILGYVFNPLSVYFCHDTDDRLAAVVYEVKNTFGDQHCYVLPAESDARGQVHHGCEKRMFVSPFIGMQARYRFSLQPPGERLSVVIKESVPEGPQLVASLSGTRETLDDGALARMFLRYPLMTLKVIAGIHWEALFTWLRGATYHAPLPPPDTDVTFTDTGRELREPARIAQ